MNDLVTYKSGICHLGKLLGLGCFHLLETPEILSYTSRIIETLNTWLTLEDKETQRDNVKLFLEYYQDGLTKLTGHHMMNELLDDYGYSRSEPDFRQRFFVMAWTNVYTTLYMELLYGYPEFFTTSPIDCHECCGNIGEDESGNPIYTSGPGNLTPSFVSGCGCGK